MYTKVLVPLDGSELAECSLPHVRDLAKDGAVGEVILLTVAVLALPYSEINLDNGVITPSFDLVAFRRERLEASRKYLEDVQSRLAAEGIKARTELQEGDRPAQAIVEYARKNGVNMIVIATHGYTGMKRMLFGSVALGVLHDSPVPVLLIRPEACQG